MSTPTKLFEPYKLGPLTLPNRLVMAPLTRNRAVAGLVPSPLAIEYYGQRASAGLNITSSLSKREKIRRKPFSLRKSRSTSLRFL